jgi:hypothetical protein
MLPSGTSELGHPLDDIAPRFAETIHGATTNLQLGVLYDPC